jgi:hypothetical protein
MAWEEEYIVCILSGWGSGIRCLFDPWIQDPGSGMGLFWIPDLGSRIPNSDFLDLSDNFLGEKFHNSLKFGPNFFLEQLKNKIILHFVKFVATKKNFEKIFFFTPPFSCCLWIRDPGSEIRDPGSEIRDPGSGIRDPGSGIRDPGSRIRDG